MIFFATFVTKNFIGRGHQLEGSLAHNYTSPQKDQLSSRHPCLCLCNQVFFFLATRCDLCSPPNVTVFTVASRKTSKAPCLDGCAMRFDDKHCVYPRSSELKDDPSSDSSCHVMQAFAAAAGRTPRVSYKFRAFFTCSECGR